MREFARFYNDTPADYIKTKRLERAAGLLLISDERISDIASTVALMTLLISPKALQTPTTFHRTLTG